LCVLSFNDVAIYKSIKNVADTKAGIHTVCVVG
jgi:eukaryotic translation initiation factor 2C